MIHTRLDGAQEAVVQEAPFGVRVSSGGANPPGSLDVGVAAVPIVAAAAENFLVLLRNISTLGQIIYVDTTAAVSPANAGIVLYPGEEVTLSPVSTNLFAIADAAAARLRTFILRTA